MRLLRILKLTRVFRASRILQRWKAVLGFPVAMTQLGKYAFVMVRNSEACDGSSSARSFWRIGWRVSGATYRSTRTTSATGRSNIKSMARHPRPSTLRRSIGAMEMQKTSKTFDAA